jgi:hypothetical protein
MNIISPNTQPQEFKWIPQQIREGVFCAEIEVRGEPLYAFLELLTQENAHYWQQFKIMNTWVAKSSANGLLSGLLTLCEKGKPPSYTDPALRKDIGFTDAEYEEFIEEANAAIQKTNGKIVEVIAANSTGSDHMLTGFFADRQGYIAYISKNKDFSIKNCNFPILSESIRPQNPDRKGEERSLKNYIKLYGDILISVGSDFTDPNYINNRGISRNVWWVFKNKYNGLSMLLKGAIGVVTARFFPKKKKMQVKPVGSMQVIIIKELLPGEGYANKGSLENQEKVDLTDLKASPKGGEGPVNHIKISALTRIYLKHVMREVKRSIVRQSLSTKDPQRFLV